MYCHCLRCCPLNPSIPSLFLMKVNANTLRIPQTSCPLKYILNGFLVIYLGVPYILIINTLDPSQPICKPRLLFILLARVPKGGAYSYLSLKKYFRPEVAIKLVPKLNKLDFSISIDSNATYIATT